ncbi:MAG: hypothetical protein HFE77_02335 [Clostridiales bacterium]|nr:hypothetical protein [Clostridiales bacterium]
MALDKEKIMELWNEGASRVKKTAMDTKDKVAAKYNLSKLNTELEEMYITLGMVSHKAYGCQDKNYDEELLRLHKQIDAQLDEIAAARTELEAMTGKKVCALCGKTVKEEYDYCPFCGQKSDAEEMKAAVVVEEAPENKENEEENS